MPASLKPKGSDRQMNRSEIAKLIAIFKASAPQADVPPETTEAWLLALDDVPYEAGLFAAREWIRNRKWFPFPSEVRAIVATQLAGLPPADEAWRMVMARMKATYPSHQAPDWDAPTEVKLAVEAMGGMYPLRMSTAPLDDEQRFSEHYTAICERALRSLDIPAAWSAHIALPETTASPMKELVDA